MEKVVIAFDVDGTLRCNCTPTCQDPNERVVSSVEFFTRMKNTHVMIWSGGGKDYAQRFIDLYGLKKVKAASKLDPSTWPWGRPHIAIDDQQGFNMANINLIVREK